MNQKGVAPIIIILIIIGILALGGGIYYYQFQKPKTLNEKTTENEIEKTINELENQKNFPLIQFTLKQGANPEIIKEVIKNTDGELTTEKQITDFGWNYYYVKFKTPRTTDELNNLINELKEKSKNIPEIINIWFVARNEGLYQRIFEKELEAIYGKSLSPNEVLSEFITALEVEDINKAITYLRPEIREDYKAAFQQAKEDSALKEMVEVFKTFEEEDIGDNIAEFNISVKEDNEIITFSIVLMRNTQGHWEIYSF